MDIEQLQNLLISRLEATEKGGEYRIPKEKEVTVLLKTGADLLHVNKVRRLETGEGTVTLVTNDSEYFVEAGEIFALKLEGSRLQRGDSRAGFRRE